MPTNNTPSPDTATTEGRDTPAMEEARRAPTTEHYQSAKDLLLEGGVTSVSLTLVHRLADLFAHADAHAAELARLRDENARVVGEREEAEAKGRREMHAEMKAWADNALDVLKAAAAHNEHALRSSLTTAIAKAERLGRVVEVARRMVARGGHFADCDRVAGVAGSPCSCGMADLHRALHGAHS